MSKSDKALIGLTLLAAVLIGALSALFLPWEPGIYVATVGALLAGLVILYPKYLPESK